MLGPLSPLGHVEPKAWDEVMAVNVTANWRLIRAMDPLLQFSDAGRVVFVSSGVAQLALAYWGPTPSPRRRSRRWRAPMRRRPRRPSARQRAQSRPVRTRMRAQAMPGEDPMTLTDARPGGGKIVELCLPSMHETGKLYAYPKRRFLDSVRRHSDAASIEPSQRAS